MNVRIHIEQVVIEGPAMTKPQTACVKAAAESELTRLVQSGRLAPEILAGGAIWQISAPGAPLQQKGDYGAMGRQIAQAVFRGIAEPHSMSSRTMRGPAPGSAQMGSADDAASTIQPESRRRAVPPGRL